MTHVMRCILTMSARHPRPSTVAMIPPMLKTEIMASTRFPVVRVSTTKARQKHRIDPASDHRAAGRIRL